MATPVNGNRGFFSNLYQSFKDGIGKPAYDKFHPYYGFSPFTSQGEIFNPIIEHLDNTEINPEILKLQLNQLKNNHQGLLDYKTLAHLDEVLHHLNNPDLHIQQFRKNLARLSGCLKNMRLAASGFLSTEYRFSAAEKIFGELKEHFVEIQKIFNHQAKLDNLPKHTEEAYQLLSQLLKEKERYFYNKKLSSKDERKLVDALTAFKKFSALPKSLQSLCSDPQFSEILNTEELLRALSNFSAILDKTISSQESISHKASSAAYKSGENAIKASIPNAAHKAWEAFNPEEPNSQFYIKTLHDTIVCFTARGDQARLLPDPEKKLEIIKKLAEKCSVDLPEFKDFFDQKIADALLRASANTSKLFTNENTLVDCFKDALLEHLVAKNYTVAEDASCDALIKLCSAHQLTTIKDYSISVEDPAAPKPFQPPVNPFTLLSNLGSSNLAAYTIPFIDSFFNSTTLEAWIEAQSQDTQTIAREFVAKGKQIINTAKTTKTLEAYQNAFKELKETFNAHHISLNGFPLPAFLENPELTETQAQDAVNSIQRMRQMLDASEPNHLSESLSAEQITEKIQVQSKEFGQNLQDFLTFKILGGYFLGKKDLTFYHIKKAQLAVVNENRDQYFYNEMKREISQSSVNWFIKKGLLFLFPFIYRFVGRYTKNIVTNFHNDLNDSIASLNKHRLLIRASNCFSQYNALLKTWASKPEGGDKDVVIGELMKDKRFLSFGETSFSQQELYEKLSSSIANKYLDLYKGPEGNFGPSSFFTNITRKINNFVQSPVFNDRRGSISSVINKLCIAIKAIGIGAPAHVGVFMATIPLWGWEMFMNALIRKAAKSYLADSQALYSLFDASKKDIFDNNTYVYPVTSFFADQLEALSIKLSSMSSSADDSSESEEPFVISDKARANVKTAFENLFELIKKNEFKTQDSLKAFLEKKEGLGKLKDDFNSLLTSQIIDNVIDITFTAYQEMLSEQSLQGSILMLLENLNQSLLSEPNQSEEKKRADHLKNQMAQEKLTKYSEKVLNQVIDQVINLGLDAVTHQQSDRSTKFINWLKPQIDILTGKYYQFLEDISTKDEMTQEEGLAELESLRERHNTFQLELESKFESLSSAESNVAKELKAKLNPVFTQLKELLEHGLLALRQSQSTLLKLENDQPHFAACHQAFAALHTALEDLLNDSTNKEAKQILKAQYKFLASHLKKIQHLEQDLELQRPSSSYDQLREAIRANIGDFTAAMNAVDQGENILKSLDIFNDFSSGANGDTSLQQIVRLKKETLAHSALYHMIRGASLKELQNLHRETSLKLKQAVVGPNQTTLKTTYIQLLENLMSSSTPEAVDNICAELQALNINQAIEDHKKALSDLYRASFDAAEPLSTAFNTQKKHFEEVLEDNQDNFDQIQQSITQTLENLERANEELKPMQFIDGELGITKGLKSLPHAVIYHTIKPKMQGILDLLRNGNFAQFFLNHTLVVPFVTQ